MSVAALLFLMLQSVPPGGTHHANIYPYHGPASPTYENEVNFFSAYDRNRNDFVDRRELDAVAIRADRTLAQHTPSEKGVLISAMTRAFAELDQNGDGRVSRQEFQQANQLR